jgi:hypothetical protein
VRETTLAGLWPRASATVSSPNPAVELLLGHEVRAVNGEGHVEAVTVEDLHSGALVVVIGATPTPTG